MLEGGCACGAVRYRLNREPLIVHGCHCEMCQRQSGSYHAVNALIESNHVERIRGAIADWDLPTPSGAGQTVTRCVECGVAVWSNYHALTKGHRDLLRFVRAGTLDEPSRAMPDVHIYCGSRNKGAPEPAGAPAFDEFYRLRDVWPAASMARLDALLDQTNQDSQGTAGPMDSFRRSIPSEKAFYF